MSSKDEKIQRERGIFEFIKTLTFNAMGIDDSLISIAIDESIDQKEKISQEKFNKNFKLGFERYFYNNQNASNNNENENTKLEAGLSFMKEMIKVHGTDDDNIKAGIVAVTDYFSESSNFMSKLMQNTLNTKEYKEEFEKEQTKEEEKIIGLVRNCEI